MSVGKVCTRTVITAHPEDTVSAAAQRMAHYDVGTLIILESRRPIGIITDRDLVVRVLAKGSDPQTSTLQTLMTRQVISVPDHTSLEDALALMRAYQIRRLVVVNNDQELVGIFSLDDMLALLGEEQQAIAGLMRAMRPLRQGKDNRHDDILSDTT